MHKCKLRRKKNYNQTKNNFYSDTFRLTPIMLWLYKCLYDDNNSFIRKKALPSSFSTKEGLFAIVASLSCTGDGPGKSIQGLNKINQTVWNENGISCLLFNTCLSAAIKIERKKIKKICQHRFLFWILYRLYLWINVKGKLQCPLRALFINSQPVRD